MRNIEWEKYAASFSVRHTKISPSIRCSFTPGGRQGNRALGPWILFSLFFKGRKKKYLQKTSYICHTGAPCVCLSQECVFCCRLLLFSSAFLPPGRLFPALTQEPRHFAWPGRCVGCATKWAADALSKWEGGKREALTWEIPRRPVLWEPRASWVGKKKNTAGSTSAKLAIRSFSALWSS